MAAAERSAGLVEYLDQTADQPRYGGTQQRRMTVLQDSAPTTAPDFEPGAATPARWLPRPAIVTRPLGASIGEALAARVIPRLRLAHSLPAARPHYELLPASEDVAALSRLLLAHDNAAAAQYVEALRSGGVPLEWLYLDLLTPVARQLGQFWDDDLCDLATVALGLSQMRRMMRDYSADFRADPGPVLGTHSVLLTPLPGDQHTFGLNMVADFFSRAGWRTQCAPVRSVDELAAALRRDAYDVVGFSVGSSDRMELLATTIRQVRRASRNQAIGVMVGGPVFSEHPDYVGLVGADATASDARQAPLQAAKLLTLLAQRG